MSSLTAIFGSNSQETDSQESEKLLQLYWNRAELKKEFASMRDEQFKLQDQLKQAEGATARVQQQLDRLEDLLIDPEWSSNVQVFYQLRGLAKRCEKKLAAFAEQLKQQREQKQHNDLMVDWNESTAQERTSVERKLRDARDSIHRLELELQTERQRLTGMRGIMRLFRRRKTTMVLDGLADQIDSARQEEEILVRMHKEICDRPPPEHMGLDNRTKRTINFMIIAFAQQLILTLNDDEVSSMAKEASEKSVGAINYGDRHTCQQLLKRIHSRIALIEQDADYVETLQRRTQLIKERAVFRLDADVVPVAGTVSTLYEISTEGVVNERELNVLGLNYWGISKVLSR